MAIANQSGKQPILSLRGCRSCPTKMSYGHREKVGISRNPLARIQTSRDNTDVPASCVHVAFDSSQAPNEPRLSSLSL